MSRTAPALARVAIAATVLLLAGCAPSAPAPVTPSISPTPSAERTQGSFDRVPLECGDLTIAEDASAALGLPVEPRDPLATYAAATGTMPRLAHVLAAGGLVCEWSNGVPSAPVLGMAPDYVGAEIQILPDAAGGWQEFVDYYGLEGPRQESCGETTCTLNDFTNDHWTSVIVHGASDSAAASEWMRGLADAVAGLPEPPAYEAKGTSGAACATFLSADEVRSLLGADLPYEQWDVGGGWSLWAAARTVVGGETCGGAWSTFDASFGTMHDGETVMERTLASSTVPSTPEPLDIEGATDASIRCDDQGAQCIVDLTIDGHWLQVVVNDYAAPSVPGGAQTFGEKLASVLLERVTA